MTLYNVVLLMCTLVNDVPSQCHETRIRAQSHEDCNTKVVNSNKRSELIRARAGLEEKKAVVFSYCETEGNQDVNPYDEIVKEMIREESI